MQLNTLSPAPGSTKAKRRVGRGIGSGWGKTCGTGHKGQKSRSGGTVRPGFEGGQMPLQMRLPKYGFSSRIGRITAEVRTSELNKVDADIVDIEALRKANLITADIKRVKVMLSGDVTKSVTLQGIRVTKGAREAIEAAGGKVIDEVVEKPKKKLIAKTKPAKTEPSTGKEPAAKKEPSAKKEPAAKKEPSAKKEPAAKKEASAKKGPAAKGKQPAKQKAEKPQAKTKAEEQQPTEAPASAEQTGGEDQKNED